MGLTYVRLKIRKNKGSEPVVEEEFLVDSGAAFTLAPARVLAQLGVEPEAEESFTLANGERISRKMGEAYFEYGQKHGYSKVIFGEEGDSNLLGSLTLGVFGLVLDPLKRELKPMPMVLM